MYNVAVATDDKCIAEKGCRLCIMYCPEPDCVMLNTDKMVAEVVLHRCKGCELCVVVCDAAKHNAIEMLAVGGDGKILDTSGESAELGQAYQ